ncbi:MAG: class I SAM-dependent methyltransferase [Planctomycetota bacterium]
MCQACNMTLPTADTEALGNKIADMLNGAGLALMMSVAHRTGLFDAMAGLGPRTTDEIAEAAELNERYVREWLGGMVTGGIVNHDPDEMTYWLPDEHAALLTRASSPNCFAVTTQWVNVLASAEDKIVDAFRDGGGLDYADYNRFNEVMAEESEQTVVAALDEHLLPLDPTLRDRLEEGVDVLDMGCGQGMAILRLAEMFPDSRFTGVDMLGSAIDAANAEAIHRGLGNVQFMVGDAARLTHEDAFDVVFTFDSVHDQADPEAMLATISRALRPGGLYFCQDIKGQSSHADNMDHPLAPFMYTVSMMHCMSVSLGQGGRGLGAMWGRQVAERMFAEAGFGSVEVHELEHDPINYFYLCRHAAA